MMRIADSWVVITTLFDLLDTIFDLMVQLHRALDRGLRVKFSGKRDLEQHVLHDIGAERRDRA